MKSTHKGKKCKIKNGGTIGLQIGEFIDQDTGEVTYQILEDSIESIYLGFKKVGQGRKIFALDTILAVFGVILLAWRSVLSFFSKKVLRKEEVKDK